ncbi:hypothetical protein F5Y13DRAFT_51978 [Hypoxylon sp. FL1857]|nr:hypothetical protein F5Y13DRAFT_51978 [Hypoxylon sp. FL1857]
MGYISPLFSLLGRVGSSIIIIISPPRGRSGRPIHIRLTGTSNMVRELFLHMATQNPTTTTTYNLTGSSPGYLAYPPPSTDLEKAARAFVGLSDRAPQSPPPPPKFPSSQFSPPPHPPPSPYHHTWTIFSIFFSCDSYKLHVGNITGLRICLYA